MFHKSNKWVTGWECIKDRHHFVKDGDGYLIGTGFDKPQTGFRKKLERDDDDEAIWTGPIYGVERGLDGKQSVDDVKEQS